MRTAMTGLIVAGAMALGGCKGDAAIETIDTIAMTETASEAASAPEGAVISEAADTATGTPSDQGITDHGITDHGITDHGDTGH